MNDLISRQAAIDSVEFGITYVQAIDIETGKVTDLFATTNKELEKAINRLAQLPSAERHGRWINCGWSLKCSICDYDMPFAVRNYCPNCGAKMDEVTG